MLRGDFAGAFAVNDQVLAARDPAGRDDPRLPYHRRWVWDGRPWRGRHVLVRCYHGLGDTLQFARFLPRLGAEVASLTVEVQPELLPLLATLAGAGRLVPFDPAAPRPPAECDIEIMELAHALRLPPTPAPYLRVEPAGGAALGLCWEAGNWDNARSLPAALLGRLLRPGCVSLLPRPTDQPVANPDGCPREIMGTAAMIAGLERVVTVDSMVAHLAGALGRPTWLLLKHEADWRWGEGDRTPWYPSMRLFRQRAPGDWAAVVDEIAWALG